MTDQVRIDAVRTDSGSWEWRLVIAGRESSIRSTNQFDTEHAARRDAQHFQRTVEWRAERIARRTGCSLARARGEAIRDLATQNWTSLAAAHIELLESLFGRTWFEQQQRKRSNHPALHQWSLLHQVMAGSGRLSWSASAIYGFLEATLANLNLIEVTKGDPDNIKLGALANVQNATLQRRLKKNILKGSQFHDLLVEMRCLAFHKSKSNDIKPLDDLPGMPDFVLRIPGWDLPVLADCKRLAGDPTRIRLKRHIEKANKQVKRWDSSCFGVVYLDVSESVTTEMSDELPREISAVCDHVADILKIHFRSISGVVLMWRQHQVSPMTDGSGGLIGFFGYKSLVVRHLLSKHPFPTDTAPLLVAYTGFLKILPAPPR